MKVLMVGCGAVGQVFGLGLQKAGVELGILEQPARVERLKQALEQGGLSIYRFVGSRGRQPLAQRLERYHVLTDETECQRFQPDLIWFTTPSPVYHSEWFQEFLQKVPSRRVVCFAPEGARSEFFPKNADRQRLVFGGITFMAWQGDLEAGGGRDGAVHYWLPPMLSIPLVGMKEACREVGRLLKKAGFQVTLGRPDSPMQASVTGVMTTFMAGLELAGWSLGAFRKSTWLKKAASGSREAVLGQLSKVGMFTRIMLPFLFSPATFRLATILLPWLVPFDIEKYIKYHYLKTRDQTLTLLEVFKQDAKKRGLAVENIQALLDGLLNPA